MQQEWDSYIPEDLNKQSRFWTEHRLDQDPFTSELITALELPQQYCDY